MQTGCHKRNVINAVIAGASAGILLMAGISFSAPPPVTWICSTQNAPWVNKGPLSVTSVSGTPAMVVDTARKYQLIDGFGGAFNEFGWKPMMKLSQALRDSVMKAIFGPDGCNYTICRMPIGASDYSYGYYSLDDSAGDYQIAHLSLARDSMYLIPYIRAAMKANPKLKVWGSPWTPPTWMKVNHAYNNVSGNNLIHDQRTNTAYALYFEKTVLAYRAIGIDFCKLFFQNEPYANQIYPSCIWSGADMQDFMKNYLGPLFTRDNIKCELWTPTMNNGSYAEAFGPMLDDTACSKYITGCGFQWAGEGAIATVYQRHPEKKLWQTEAECRSGANNWDDANYIFGKMIFYFQNGCGNFMQWNMLLEKTGNSNWGWSQNAMVTVDTIARAVTFTPEFYMTKHFTNAVKPGARRINATSAAISSGDYAAFQNSNGQSIVVVRNTGTSAKTASIQFGPQMISPSLPAGSFNTFYIGESPDGIADHSAVHEQRRMRDMEIMRCNGDITISAHTGAGSLEIVAPNGDVIGVAQGMGTYRLRAFAWPSGIYYAKVNSDGRCTVNRFAINK